MLSEAVRDAVPGPDLCHRETEFFDLQDAVRTKLLAVYDLDPNTWSAILLGGSGTAALEAMIASCTPAGGKLAVLENGVYGERISDIASVHQIATTALHLQWGENVDPRAIETLLADDPTTMGAVHHETTTGRLNNLTEFADACAANGSQLLVDAISSFGAEAIPFDHPALSAVAGTANKCLHGIPGLSFVIVRRDLLERCTARSLYLDLRRYAKAQESRP